jgi:hypothetical protein
MGEATFFWKSDPDLDSPDLQTCQGGMPMCSAETAIQFSPPAGSWTLMAGLVRPKSRGRIRLTGADPGDPIEIEANTLAHPDDMKAAIACVELCREIGNSGPLSPFVKREVMPGNLKGAALENFIRNAASSYWHQTCTAKMGHDAMSVVDGSLKVHGIDHPRIADGSIMPRVTIGNTMAPCVVIGERAAEMLKIDHRCDTSSGSVPNERACRPDRERDKLSGNRGSVTPCKSGAAVCPSPATSPRFTELQERHAMTQTPEPGIKSEHAEGERTRENGAQPTNAERHAIRDNSEHLRFAIADLEANSGPGLFNIRVESACPQAGRPWHRDPPHGGMSCGYSKSQAPQRLFYSLAPLRL